MSPSPLTPHFNTCPYCYTWDRLVRLPTRLECCPKATCENCRYAFDCSAELWGKLSYAVGVQPPRFCSCVYDNRRSRPFFGPSYGGKRDMTDLVGALLNPSRMLPPPEIAPAFSNAEEFRREYAGSFYPAVTKIVVDLNFPPMGATQAMTCVSDCFKKIGLVMREVALIQQQVRIECESVRGFLGGSWRQYVQDVRDSRAIDEMRHRLRTPSNENLLAAIQLISSPACLRADEGERRLYLRNAMLALRPGRATGSLK